MHRRLTWIVLVAGLVVGIVAGVGVAFYVDRTERSANSTSQPTPDGIVSTRQHDGRWARRVGLWDASRVRDPAHKDRLLLVLQLAALFVLAQGAFVLQQGSRHVLERTDRTTLSLLSLGLRWLDRARSHLVPPHLPSPFPLTLNTVG